MSCNITKYRVINDLSALKQILFPEQQTDLELNRDDDYENRWNWDSSELMTSSINASITGTDNIWLSECLASISPLADVMAFARNNYLAVYRIKSDINDATNYRELSLTYDTTLTTEPNELITNILCVPLVSQQKTSFGCADWTAIVIGFTSGYIRIYTETGGLVLSQLLHDEPIVNLKCQTFCSNSSGNDQTDELIIVYRTAVVVIDGFALYQTLRLSRNKLAKTHSLSTGFNLAFGNTIETNSLPLTYKKYSLQNCDTIVDCVNAGNHSRITYDALVSQSLSGVPHSKSSSADLLVTIGENPFIGFFRAYDGSSHTILNELTQAMINKVKNLIPLSLFASNSEDNTQNKIEPSTPIPLRLGFFDQREGIRLSLSPNKRLAAVLDDFGRVILIDVHNWMAIRMWKGYRDAEIGWIEVDEETPVTHLTKRAIFLVIYAPKRGILEIWSLELGARVTAFNVRKCCRLFQCSYSMMGLNHMMFKQLKSLPDFSPTRCFLFDYNNGTLYNIDIPFLCALSDKNSKRMRDMHLLKELKNILKQYNSEHIEKVLSIVLMIKTADIRKQALDEITRISDTDLIKRVASQLKEFLLQSIEKNELDYENKLIAQMCSRIVSLCTFYQTIQSHRNNDYNSFKTESSRPPDIQYLMDKLNWNGSDIAKILSLIAFRDSVIVNQLNLSQIESVNILEFLSHFTLYSNHIVKDGSDEIYSAIPIELIMSDQNELKNVAYFIFIALFQTNEIDLENYLRNSCIVPSNLLFLLFVSWLSSNCCEYWKCWEHLSLSLNFIISLTASENLNEENYLHSLNWREILQVIYDSPNITGALIAVNMIKSVNFNVTKNDNNKSSSNDSDMEWETLHVDNEFLNSVIKQFEDLLLLDMLLRSNKLKDTDIAQNQISLTNLMRGGPGIVSELVAKWIINSNISADVLYNLLESNNTNENNDKNEDNSLSIGEDALKYENVDIETLSELLDHVRRCFPNCLESDVLFANCSWELLVQWNKEPSVIDNNLKNSLVYLNYVTSAVLKHNVACLLWKTYILKRFETLALLMEKMGRMPKERICKKELGMGENCIEGFLDYSCQLLEFILQTNMMAEIEPMPLFSIDDWWKSQSNSAINNVPLVILAIHQKLANSALVLEHSRLSTAMFFIVMFQLKSCRPLSLFSHAVQQYFFKDFYSFPVYTSYIEPTLSENRVKYLMNVITAIVQTLPADNHSERDKEFDKTKLFSQANKLYGKVITLSREWELNTDEIRRKFVCELYSYGCDSLVEEVIPSVVDISKLGSQMITVAGLRVIYAINSKFGSLDEMHTLPPNTLFWLKSLDQNTSCYSECSLECTLAMLEHINNFIYSDKTYGRICETLIETVKHLIHN